MLRALFVAIGVAGAGALLVSRPARAQPADPFALPAEKLVLPNGLAVVLAPDPHARLASVEVSYHAGAADDPDGLRGLAHMVEHLVAAQTKHVPDVARELEAAGGCRMNATTSLDVTTYFESVPPERLANALWIESDRMGHSAEAVTDERVAAQALILANEDRDRNLDAALAAVGSFTLHELFPAWHPYAVAEGAGDIDRIHTNDVLAFLHTWYLPSNATLVIAGAFDRDATLALVTRDFGGLPSTAAPQRPELPDATTAGAWLAVKAATAHDQIIFAWRTPAYGSREDAALDLAATALAGVGNDLLTPLLVATHLAIGVNARQASFRRGSVFSIAITLAPGVDMTRVVRVTQQAVDDLARTDITTETVRAQEVWRNATLESLETTWGRAAHLIATDLTGEPGAKFDWGFGRHASIDSGDVAGAASRWLDATHRVVTVIFADPSGSVRGRLVRREDMVPRADRASPRSSRSPRSPRASSPARRREWSHPCDMPRSSPCPTTRRGRRRPLARP